jgi:hypothetical protein
VTREQTEVLQNSKGKKKSQGTYEVVREVYEMLHSVIFIKLQEGLITFFVYFIFVVKLQINFLYIKPVSLFVV